MRTVALLGLIVAAGLFALDGQGRGAAQAASPASKPKPSAALLLNYGLIGAASLLLEMAWLRLFSLVMLRTEYVLALILAVMLFGMGLGSLLASRRVGPRLLAALPWCACACAIAGLWLLPAVSGWMERVDFHSLGAAMLGQGLLLSALTLPVTLCLGAWLPALTSRFSVDGTWLYAANSSGAALGALLYVVLSARIGSAGALALAAMLLLLPGLILVRSRRAWLGVPLMLGAAWPVAVLPPVKDLLPQAMAGSRDLYRYEDAIAISQVVEQYDGQRVLLTDLRRFDASTEPTAVFVQTNQARLPLLLHAKPRTVLFLGIGTGISLAGSLPFSGPRSAAPWSCPPAASRPRAAGSPTAIAACSSKPWSIRTMRGISSAPRHATYDVIIGDLFHPGSGRRGLAALRGAIRARARAARRGRTVRAMAGAQPVRSAHTGHRAAQLPAGISGGKLFLDGMHLALVGPRNQWPGARGLTAHLNWMTAEQRRGHASEGANEWLGRYWGPIAKSVGPTQHEWEPVIEFLLPRLHYGQGAIPPVLESLLARRPSIERAMQLLKISPPQQEEFRRAYIGTELRVRSELAGWQGDPLEADHLLGLAFEADPAIVGPRTRCRIGCWRIARSS